MGKSVRGRKLVRKKTSEPLTYKDVLKAAEAGNKVFDKWVEGRMSPDEDWEKFYCDEHCMWVWDYCPHCAEDAQDDVLKSFVDTYVDFADELIGMITEKRICVCDCEKNYGKTCKHPEKYKDGGCK